jgi:ribosomal protein S18 acetylase RimI-like enzyme
MIEDAFARVSCRNVLGEKGAGAAGYSSWEGESWSRAPVLADAGRVRVEYQHPLFNGGRPMGATEANNIELRWAIRPGDLGRVLHLHGVLYAREMEFDLTFEGYVAATLAHFASPIDPSRERLWLAEVDGRLVGCVAIVKHAEEVAQLRWLLVDPAFRGRGLGRRLVEEALTFARAAGYRSVFLDTVKELPVAAELYRSAGFKLVKEETHRLWGRELTEQRYELRWN